MATAAPSVQAGFVWDYSGHFFHFKRSRHIEEWLRDRMPGRGCTHRRTRREDPLRRPRHRFSVSEAHPPAAVERVPGVSDRAVSFEPPRTRAAHRSARCSTRGSVRASRTSFCGRTTRSCTRRISTRSTKTRWAGSSRTRTSQTSSRTCTHTHTHTRAGCARAWLQRDVHVSGRRRDPLHPRAASRSAGRCGRVRRAGHRDRSRRAHGDDAETAWPIEFGRTS